MIDAVPRHSRELIISVEEPPPAAVSAVADFFDLPTDSIRLADPTDSRPEVCLRANGEQLLAGNLERLWKAVTTTAEVLRTEPEETAPLSLLDQLETATFRSQSVSQLIVASRYVERRAERHAVGTLYACFQHLSRFERDLRTMIYYGVLAETDLEIHLFGVPDTALSEEELLVHDVDSEELARTWLVAYDGDGVDARKAALVAEETGPRQYRGFWTTEADCVDEIIGYLTASYLS